MFDEEDVLEHFGVKGMKWGVRKQGNVPKGPTPVTTTHKPGGRIKTAGGERQPAHEDAVKAAVIRRTGKKSGTDALSDKDLQALVNRLNMEQNYSRLTASPSKKFVTDFILGQGKQGANQVATDIRTKKVAKAMGKAA